MTPKSKITIAAITLSLTGASAAYALGPVMGTPDGAATAVQKVDDRGEWRERHGWRRHGGQERRGERGRGGHGGPRHGGMFGHGPHGMIMMEVIRQADTDGDGALTQDEINAYIAGLVSSADADNSGTVSLEEFKTIWLEVTQRPMVRAFQFVDSDGSAEISEEETTALFGSIVQKMDRNDDGKLDRSDRGRGFGKRGPGGPGPRPMDDNGDDD